jgi:hypothetical protein
MKKALSYIIVFILGALTVQVPDLIMLYNDRVMSSYRDKTCDSKNNPESCDFFAWYETYQNDHPKLSNLDSYFIMGEGPLYMGLSGKCSNHIFHNRNAAPRDSGKITNRNYFFTHCSHLAIAISDLVYRDGDKEQDFEPHEDHL